jgi:Asp-tRNA(Asn)/Glu-tRNA(Gln) amidotransferase A subunit family amidase
MILGPMLAGHEAATSPFLRQYMEWATAHGPHTAESLLQAWLRRDALRAEFAAATREFPVLLCPVAAIPAFRHGDRRWQVDGRTVEYLDAWSYTEFFNLLGNPGMVVPVSRSAEGLPIGVQVVTPLWQEELALAVAGEIEAATGGWQRPQGA